jgi:hypothetical protein
MTHTSPVRWLAPAAVVLTLSSAAEAETRRCTAITSLPYTISAPGSYCLNTDLSTPISAGRAITIISNSVTLDLNGHKLAGNAGVATTADGVYAANRKYVVVKNGTIKGFMRAVHFQGSSSIANIIEGITAERNFNVGLRVDGVGSSVRRNLVVNTGGTTVQGGNANNAGIALFGSANVILENEIMNVAGTGTGVGYGIVMDTSDDTVVESNRIAAVDTGIYADGTNILVSNNRFMRMPTAIDMPGSGKFSNNLTAGVSVIANGGTDAGGNH